MSGRWSRYAVALAFLVQLRSAAAKTFADHLSTPFERPIARALAQSIADSIPVPAASTGLVFELDVESGAFVRKTTMLGQLFLERADTIGRRRLNFSVSYQYLSTDTIEGEDLDSLSDTHPPIRDAPDDTVGFTIPHFGITLETHQVTTSLTYGVTDDLEMNLTVPVLYSAFGFDAVLVSRGTGEHQPDHVRASKLGIGDIFVRAKYRVLAEAWLKAAFGLVMRLPSGDDANFQGTGTTELAPLVYLSRDPVGIGSIVTLQPYLDAGATLNLDYIDQSQPRWGLGLDCGLGSRVTLGTAVLGRHALGRVGRPGISDAPRIDGTIEPLFGIQPRRADFYDFAFGGRVNLWHDLLIGFANVLVPLNSDGFRSDLIPLVGIEAAF